MKENHRYTREEYLGGVDGAYNLMIRDYANSSVKKT